MSHPDISQWLSTERPSFEAGKYLLKALLPKGAQLPFPEIILDTESTFSRKKLTEVLENLNHSVHTPPPVPDQPKRHVLGKTEGYPPQLVEMDRQLAYAWSELNSMANSTISYPEGEELKDVALAVVRMTKRIRRMWKTLDYYVATGKIDDGSAEVPDQLIEKLCYWLEKQPSLLDYTRRHRNTKDPEKRKEVDRRMAILGDIEEYLKSRADA